MSSASAKQAAMLLSRARHTGERLAAFPEALVPQDRAGAYAVQDELIALEGDVGGWKVASGVEATPIHSPILTTGYLASGVTLDMTALLADRVEVEVGIRLKSDLLSRPEGHSRQEVIDAIEGLLPALEILGNRFAPEFELPKMLNIGDLQVNAAVVTGPLRTDWQDLDLSTLKITLDIGAENWSTDKGASLDAVIDALVWLANEGSLRQGGLKAGQVIITGSRIIQPLGKPGETVSATLEGLGTVSAKLA